MEHHTPDCARSFEVVSLSHSPDSVLVNPDVIVVGSGMSGLATAALLGSCGKKVLVLEQHDTPGGSMHSFKQGTEWVSAGWHYVGKPDRLSRPIWDYLTQGQELTNDRDEVLDTNYGIASMSGNTMEQAMGIKMSHFARCANYLSLVMAVKLLPQPFAWLLWLYYRVSGKLREASSNYGDWCRRMSGEKVDRDVWWTQEGDHGMEKEKTCAVLGATIVHHYRNGQIHPKGGVRETVLRIVQRVTKNGGAVLVKAPVTKVLVEGNTVTGVVVGEDYQIRAPQVVLSNGLYNASQLLQDKFPAYLRDAMQQLGPSCGHGAVFLTFAGKTHKQLGLPDGNVWIHQKYFVSSKDSPQGCCVYIIWMMPYVPRGPEYESTKETHATAAFNYVVKLYPELEKYDQYDAATPATTQHYLNSQQGCSYGLNHSTERFCTYKLARALRPTTSIRGLFLTGQDVCCCGISGALGAALLTYVSIRSPGYWLFLRNPFAHLMAAAAKPSEKKSL